MKQVIFKEKDWKTLETYLTPRNDVESGSYAVFKASCCNGSIKFLVNQVIIPKDSDYLKRSPVVVAFTSDFTEMAFQQCERIHGHLLDIHTHPWSKIVNFSPIDDGEARETKVPYLGKYLPNTQVAFIVFGESSLIARARFWDKPGNHLSPIDRIMVI
jgi:hypothetical protein